MEVRGIELKPLESERPNKVIFLNEGKGSNIMRFMGAIFRGGCSYRGPCTARQPLSVCFFNLDHARLPVRLLQAQLQELT